MRLPSTGMLFKTPRAFHTLIALALALALALVACALCLFIETAIHWNGTIFQTGFDTESTVAVLLLLLELAYGLAQLFAVLLPPVLRWLSFVYFEQLEFHSLNFTSVLPEISPPLPLRI
jgi:hypothetical protein